MSHVSILTPYIPFICKSSPILAWAGAPKNLESFWTSPTETILWDSVWKTCLVSHCGASSISKYHSFIWWDHRTKKETKEKPKREMELVDLAQKQWGVGTLACVHLLFLVTFLSFLSMQKSAICVEKFWSNQLCFSWLSQWSREVTSSMSDTVPRISRSGFHPQLTIFSGWAKRATALSLLFLSLVWVQWSISFFHLTKYAVDEFSEL